MSTDDHALTVPFGRSDFLLGLQAELTDPIHLRLIQAYEGDNPVESMETELGEILMEVLRRED